MCFYCLSPIFLHPAALVIDTLQGTPEQPLPHFAPRFVVSCSFASQPAFVRTNIGVKKQGDWASLTAPESVAI